MGGKRMKHTKYYVTFITGIVEIVYAFNKYEASILAMAEMINEGNNYTIVSIEEKE